MDSEHRHELKTNELADWIVHAPEYLRKNYLTILGVLLIIGVPVFLLGLKFTGALEHMSEKLNTTRAWTEAHRYQYQYYH